MTKKYNFNQYGDGKIERHEPVAVTMENGFARLVSGANYSPAEQFGADDCKELLSLLVDQNVAVSTSMLWSNTVEPDIEDTVEKTDGSTYKARAYSPKAIKTIVSQAGANYTLYDTLKKTKKGGWNPGIKIYVTVGEKKEAKTKTIAPAVISRKPAQPQTLKRKQ